MVSSLLSRNQASRESWKISPAMSTDKKILTRSLGPGEWQKSCCFKGPPSIQPQKLTSVENNVSGPIHTWCICVSYVGGLEWSNWEIKILALAGSVFYPTTATGLVGMLILVSSFETNAKTTSRATRCGGVNFGRKARFTRDGICERAFFGNVIVWWLYSLHRRRSRYQPRLAATWSFLDLSSHCINFFCCRATLKHHSKANLFLNTPPACHWGVFLGIIFAPEYYQWKSGLRRKDSLTYHSCHD